MIPVNIKGKPKQFANVETQVAIEGEQVEAKTETEVVEVPGELVHPNGMAMDAEIEFGLQSIIPTGDYQNIRVIVGAKCRCEADTDVMDGTFKVIKDWVDNKIHDVITEITSGSE